MDFNKKLTEALGLEPKQAAPATAPPKPKPATPIREPKPKPSPFNPPRPQQDPEPKNIFRPKKPAYIRPTKIISLGPRIVSEAYEDEAHPSTQRFWRERARGHTFSKHPIMAMYGHELSKSAWEHVKEKCESAGVDINQLMPVVQDIMAIERRHANELIDLAKRITVQIWGIPEEMLQGQLTNDVEQNTAGTQEREQSRHEINPDVQKLINKRITMNALTHGSAVHAMLTMHHAVDKEIERIEPRLLDLYNKISAGSVHWYWLIDIPQMFGMLGAMAIGSESIKWDDEDRPTVDARAAIFPVLAQEMNKGVAELISLHGLSNMDAETTKTVLHHADDVRHEPYLIQIGPELWRRFLKVRPKDIPLADIVHAFAELDPDQLHSVVSAVVEDPDHARETLAELFREEEEWEAPTEWTPESDYGEEGETTGWA